MNEIKIRQSQITYTYAPGAIGDFPGVSGMFLSHDHEEYDWGKPEQELSEAFKYRKRRILIDKRLSDAFNIQHFVLPPLGLEKASNSIKMVRFPMSLYCPSCGRIHFVSDLEQYGNGYIPNKQRKFDEELCSYYCTDCLKKFNRPIELVPTRFIIANEEGYIDDFPWDWFVHRKNGFKEYRGKGHILKLGFGSSSASLSSIEIKSYNKNDGSYITKESLGDIFNQENTFIQDGDEYLPFVKNYMPKPWHGRNGEDYVKELISDVPMPKDIPRNSERNIVDITSLAENDERRRVVSQIKRKYPRTLQRGANNIYFPLVFKGIRLPEGLNETNIELLEAITILKSKFLETQPDKYTSLSPFDWKEELIKFKITFPSHSDTELEDVLNKLFPELENGEKSDDADKKQHLRYEEFNCFCNEGIASSDKIWYKARHFKTLNKYLVNEVKIEKITLLDKLNELKVFRGFTRIKPIANEDLIFESDSDGLSINRKMEYTRICDARKNSISTNELPCSEVKGEGIFIKFNDSELKKWENNSSVISRYKKMTNNLNKYFTTFDIQPEQLALSARYVLLHTLSHLIMQQLANDSGYNLSSLTEIIYCNNEWNPEQMNGILIYTSSSDTEGTLGGLVEKGNPDYLATIISKTVDKAKWCSSDPLCITSNGQGFMTTNMAACYSCVMVPETCCENINKFLDRKLVLDYFGIESL